MKQAAHSIALHKHIDLNSQRKLRRIQHEKAFAYFPRRRREKKAGWF
jgi:hypothetical protein